MSHCECYKSGLVCGSPSSWNFTELSGDALTRERPEFLDRAGLRYRHAGWPGFVDSRKCQRSTEQGHVLGEIDHLIHALIGVLNPPEIVHDGGNDGEKTNNRRPPNFGFTPSRMLAPPSSSSPPVTVTAASGAGTFFMPAYCASVSRSRK
jgi:hypothetical protein